MTRKRPYPAGNEEISMLTTDFDMSVRSSFDAIKDNITVERCNLHSRRENAIYAMAYSQANKRLCVIRRIERDSVRNLDGGQTWNVLTFVEFYNAANPPLLFLEKSIPLFDTIESCIWIDNWSIIGGLSGKLYLLSPFTSRFRRIQISTTEITSLAQLDADRFVLSNNSGEIIVLTKEEISKEAERNSIPKFTSDKIMKFSSDRHLITLASTTNRARTIIAVGMVNWVSLLTFQSNLHKKLERNDIAIPHIKTNAVIICSLLFVGDFLFAGDSRGQVTIYNGENGLLLKTFKSHQNNVLALAATGNEVFASGTDFRIQIISNVGSSTKPYDWQQAGQRTFHTNDIRSLCALNRTWLLSGGYEGLYISGRHNQICKPQLRSECSFSNGSELLLSRQLTHIDVWYKPQQFGKTNLLCKRFLNFMLMPTLLVRITSKNMGFIKQACISPNGNYICFAGNVKGAVSIVQLNENLLRNMNKEEGNNETNITNENAPIKLYWTNLKMEDGEMETMEGGKTVTTMNCTDKHLYYAVGEYILFQLDLALKKLHTIARESNAGHIIKIAINPSETIAITLTTARSSILVFRLDNLDGMSQKHMILNFDEQFSYECSFLNDNQILFVMSNLNKHLFIYDFSRNRQHTIKTNSELGLCETEWISYLADEGRNQLLATTNKGRILMISSNESSHNSLDIFLMDSSADDLNMLSMTKDNRIEAFWGKTDYEKPLLQRSIVLIGHVEITRKQEKSVRLKYFRH